VLIDGAGTLGRRIAAVYAAGGSDVRIFDLSAEQRDAAGGYVEEHLTATQRALGLDPPRRGPSKPSPILRLGRQERG
jgi:3-hydroxybutyryl-CoA dehydrogenase